MEDRPSPKNEGTKSDSGGGREDDSDLQFVVTEKNEDDREFVGGQKQFPNDDNKLGIEKTSDLMEKEALSVKGNGEQFPSSPSDFKPIGETSPPLPPEPASSSPSYAPAGAAEAQPSQEPSAGQQERVKKHTFCKISCDHEKKGRFYNQER